MLDRLIYFLAFLITFIIENLNSSFGFKEKEHHISGSGLHVIRKKICEGERFFE